MGVIFFLSDFCVCGRSCDMSIRSSTSASFVPIIGRDEVICCLFDSSLRSILC